ncbi:phage Gp37/Gp68 family protein [Sphingorhabdus soli]|uniref:Phage Gp37/Gp68 family protein n=1 Tax=Flavisphingopyxis soli TaxID=2601267 RepID=A0A5C6UN17_9SPHN|nr:phage Gp37/Gp68 family protein [Sphingorhabdus soli]TXC73930.1 phage Gp37/Gp68 family protein [Sphingorhabdus soli]
MSDGTKIEWTDATWNVVNGCSVTSPGCTNCYAMKLAGTRLKNHPSRAGLTQDTKAGPVWTGEVRFNDKVLSDPLRWKRPRMIFVCAHGDLFHENVPDEWIDRVFAVMALCPQHVFQLLTKRPERMCEYLSRRKAGKPVQAPLGDGTLGYHPFNCEVLPPSNVWLGTSVEDQARADERIPHLLATPAAVRWLSCEPLLGPVDLSGLMFRDVECPNWEMEGSQPPVDPETGQQECCSSCDWTGIVGEPAIDWIVAGGESGPGARPMHPDWARALRDQCAAADVPFFFKQWGDWELSLDRERDDPDWRADYSNDYVDRGKSRWLNIEGGRGFHGDRFVVMRRVGKKAAGRLLDGRTHDAMPRRA